MRCIKIPLAQTARINRLSADYISGNPAIKPLFEFEPSISGIKAAIQQRKNYPVNRLHLVESLKAQYSKVEAGFFDKPVNKSVIDNINSIAHENSFTITAGHQLNIFTGPLYYIYKLISVVKYTEILNEAFPENHFVPVYWMATEDHDLEEINHFHLWGNTIKWDEIHSGAVGKMNPNSMRPLIEEMSRKIGNTPTGTNLVEIFKTGYLEHDTMADATRYIVHDIFKQYGLVVVDGDDQVLKRALIPVLEEDMINNSFFKTINETNATIEKSYKLPVSPREINVFYLGDKTRTRIVFENEKYHAQETSKSWTEEELKLELKTNPENFSPNVVLRPVYQETILPNLAYIGGNNEIAYWLQLKNAFKKAKTFFPQLLVRDSALFIGKKTAKDLDTFNLLPQDLFLSLDDLNFKFYQANMLEHKSEIDSGLILDQYEALKNDLQGLPADIVGNIVKQMNLHIKEVRRWKNEIHNKQLELQEKNVARLDKLYHTFYPDGELQERHDNFIPYYLHYGTEWFQLLKSEFNPLESVCHIFVEE